MATIGRVTFAGLSTESKPTTLPGGGDIPLGSVFVCTDSGAEFVWTVTNWLPAATSTDTPTLLSGQSDVITLLSVLYREVAALRQGMVGCGSANDMDPQDIPLPPLAISN